MEPFAAATLYKSFQSNLACLFTTKAHPVKSPHPPSSSSKSLAVPASISQCSPSSKSRSNKASIIKTESSWLEIAPSSKATSVSIR